MDTLSIHQMNEIELSAQYPAVPALFVSSVVVVVVP